MSVVEGQRTSRFTKHRQEGNLPGMPAGCPASNFLTSDVLRLVVIYVKNSSTVGLGRLFSKIFFISATAEHLCGHLLAS
jgi:hypothetical protein